MMYVFICPGCGQTRMVSLLRQLRCKSCGTVMANCELEFSEWIQLEEKQRKKLISFYQRIEDKEEKLCYHRPMPHYDRCERNYW